jgi:phosphonate transport system substrate-binding protein
MLRTLQTAPPAVRNQLRILWTSPPYPSQSIAAHPRVPVAIVEQVLHAMGAMHQDPEGLALLQPLQVQGLDAAQDHEWDAVRALHIQVVPHREVP